MATAIDLTKLAHVTAPVNFTANSGATPIALVAKPGGEDERLDTVFEAHEIQIHDGRSAIDQIHLDRQGFAFMEYATAVEDFYDDEEVTGTYYPEMERLVATATGADKVVIFDHTIRSDDPLVQQARQVRQPVLNLHNDFTIRSAEQRVRDLLPAAEADARLKKRYGSVNIWRPISGPVVNKHLVICEYDSIEDRDLIAAERHYGDRIGGVYNLAHNPGQRWYYFPNMMREEVVLLKCFDSLADGTARWTCHGSFDDPSAPADAPPRQSIEIRTLMFWD